MAKRITLILSTAAIFAVAALLLVLSSGVRGYAAENLDEWALSLNFTDFQQPVLTVRADVNGFTHSGRITGATVWNRTISASSQGGSMEGGAGRFTVRIIGKGGAAKSYSFNVYDKVSKSFSAETTFFVDDSYLGAPIKAVLEYGGKEIDSKDVVYCGDGVCSKGESVSSCPGECGSKVRLSLQAETKTVQFITGGVILSLLGISVFLIARGKRQG